MRVRSQRLATQRLVPPKLDSTFPSHTWLAAVAVTLLCAGLGATPPVLAASPLHLSARPAALEPVTPEPQTPKAYTPEAYTPESTTLDAELVAQLPRPKIDQPEDDEGPRLPSGKLQREAILEHDHKKNLEDLRAIQKISQDLLEELEANTGHVFSLGSLRKMEQLEKLTKQLKNRFKK